MQRLFQVTNYKPLASAFLFVVCLSVGMPISPTQAQSTSASAATTESVALSRITNLDDLLAVETRIKEAAARAKQATVAVVVSMGHHQAQGSGVIISPDGYVLTAAHVASEPNRRVRFQLVDGRSATGVSLGMNETIDMGLMKISGDGPWPHLPLGRSADVRRGQWCLATGHPGGFDTGREPTLRVGRILKRTSSAFLTDCTLVGGDSGGPLLNLDGKVIGVHSRIGADLTTNLHVPVDRYRESWKRLASGESWGRLRTFRPWIGVIHDRASAQALIQSVDPRSPAERAGVQAGDVVVQFGERDVRRFAQLRELVGRRSPGDKVSIQILRGDVAIETHIKIGKREALDSTSQTRDDAALLEGWLEDLDRRRYRGRPATHIGKNADQIKEVFRDAASRTSKSTVLVYGGRREVALGTVVDSNGLILTKASRLSGNIRVRLPNGKRVAAERVGTLRSHDLALLRVDQRLRALPIRSNVLPPVGSLLAAVGQGSWPLAIGVVSGEPADVPSQAKLGIQMGSDVPLVDQIVSGGGADEAGVAIGDLILSVEGNPVATADDLIERIGQYYPGESVQMRVSRAGRELELKVTLGRMSDFDEAFAEFQDFIGGKLSDRRTGFPRALIHDTVILPRHCGGPVVDARGRFVGINIARADRTASYLLPATDLPGLIEHLKQNSESRLKTVGVGG